MSIKATGNHETLIKSAPAIGFSARPMALLDDGGWIITWSATTQDLDDYAVYQQRFDATGHALGVEAMVSTTTTGIQNDQSVAALADGGWVVSWDSENVDGDSTAICQQRYNADGVAVGGETVVSVYTTSHQFDARITALSDGGWLVAWTSNEQDGDNRGVVQRRYDKNGQSAGETIVNTFTSGPQQLESVAALADGGWVVTWSAYRDSDGSGGVLQQRYDEDGLAVGGEVNVNTHVDQSQNASATSGFAAGGWIVCWSSVGQDGDSYGIYQQRFNDAGAKVGDEMQVNTFTTGAQLGATVTTLADGGWVVAWNSFGQDGDASGVYQQRYAEDGAKVGDETLVNVTTAGSQGSPDLTAFEDGSWMVTWSGYSVDGSGIQQRYFAADIEGSQNAETLKGTQWDERITGFGGKDRLAGGLGQDVLAGGKGADSFAFKAADTGKTKITADTIEDFSRKQHDEIDLTAIDASTKHARNNAFDFIGTDAFSRTAGELRYDKKGADTYIYGDMNGDRKADVVIHLNGAMQLRAADFDL